MKHIKRTWLSFAILCMTFYGCSPNTLPGQFAFISVDENGYNQIFLTDRNLNTIQLTFDPTNKCCISWSPNGDRIAFASMDQEGVNQVVSINILDVDSREVTNLPPFTGQIFDIAWSPTVDQFALSAAMNFDIPSIYIMNITEGHLTRVTNIHRDNAGSMGTDYDPAWSPDGSSIVFSSNWGFTSPSSDYDNFDLYSIDLNSLTVKRLTDTSWVEINPAWSPDGTSIIYAANLSGSFTDPEGNLNFELWIMRSDGAEPRLILSGENNYYHPDISPNGNYIIFSESEEYSCVIGPCNSSLTIMDVNGMNRTSFEPFDIIFDPHWRP